MADLFHSHSRSSRLDRVLGDLLSQAPELQAAAVVSFDGLPMASALPVGMDEDRVAAMSAALLSLGERAAENFGRGSLSQVYVEGENGTVFLVSADDEAVLVAVGAKGAKVGLLMYEVRRSAASVAVALRADDAAALESESTAAGETRFDAPVAVAVEPPLELIADLPAEPAAVEHVEYVEQVEYVDYAEPAAAVPALHVVEYSGYSSPEPYIYSVPSVPSVPSAPEPEPEPAAPYEQPYAPFAEEGTLPPGPLSPWGNPMLGAPAEPNGRTKSDLGSWTSYHQPLPPQPNGNDNWS